VEKSITGFITYKHTESMRQGPPAVLGRARRVTAGRRMSSLIGKAQEDDNEFWTKSIWNEDKDGEISSDDGSYNVDDEVEENCVDVFDSDFNDSESDSDAENGIDAKSERNRNHNVKPKLLQSSRHLLRRKKGKRSNATGIGDNAGIILSMPVLPAEVQSTETHGTTLFPSDTTLGPATRTVNNVDTKVTTTKHELLSNGKIMSRRNTPSDILLQRSLRKATKVKTSEAHQNHIVAEKDSQKRARVLAQAKRKANHKRKFTQEELLVEAAVDTEPQNERWILGRKRVQALSEEKKRIECVKKDSRVALKYHSRKGCFNTITFTDMDFLPSLVKNNVVKKSCVEYCIITGKKARYRDSLTGKGYHDKEAFKELRRRHKNGDSLCGKKKATDTICSSYDNSIRRSISELQSCNSMQVEPLDNAITNKKCEKQKNNRKYRKVLRYSESKDLQAVIIRNPSKSCTHTERNPGGSKLLVVSMAVSESEGELEKVVVENSERRVKKSGQILGASECNQSKNTNGILNLKPKCSRVIEESFKRSHSVCA